VPVATRTTCTRFGFRVAAVATGAGLRPISRELPPIPHQPRPEQALAAAADSTLLPGNTLVLYLDSAWGQETAVTLKGALETAHREDAGLALLVLFREGVLEEVEGQRAVNEVEGLGRSLGLSTIINEDVQSGWATILGVTHGSGQKAWRLLTPTGAVTWMHQGQIAARELASTLNHYLMPSPPPRPESLHPIGDVGSRIPANSLIPEFPIEQAHCPPISLNRVGPAGSMVASLR
jgi:hypothetical protein